MPRPEGGDYKIWGTRATDPDKVLKKYKPQIAKSALAVTLGDRLNRRAPMPNIKGDRVDLESPESA